MSAPKSCINRQPQYSQYCRHHIIFQALITAIIAVVFNAEAVAQESNSQTVPTVKNDRKTANSVNSNPVNSSPKTESDTPTSAPQTSPSKTDAENQTESSDNSGDSQESISSSEILEYIRKKRAENNETNRPTDNLILTQSSSYVFLNQKKVRDSSENNLDYWLLSSFEGALYLSDIFPSFINISPVKINLDSDYNQSLNISVSEFPLLNNSDRSLAMSIYVNLPIPDSVTDYITENNDEIISLKAAAYIPIKTSPFNYLILALALLGFAILGYIIYRIIVWAFMLDQNKDYDFKNGATEDVVTPIGMDAFSAYFSQTIPKNKDE